MKNLKGRPASQPDSQPIKPSVETKQSTDRVIPTIPVSMLAKIQAQSNSKPSHNGNKPKK